MSTVEIRHYITLLENALLESDLAQIKSQKKQLLASLSFDANSAAAVLEMHEIDEDELASIWFDACLGIYRNIVTRGHAPIYRHMMVGDFAEFIEGLHNGTNSLGEYWSYNPDIESPTWKENQRGDVPVLMQGKVDVSQIDWFATLQQNFEWPHEGELIFNGNVFVEWIQDRDTDKVAKFEQWLPR